MRWIKWKGKEYLELVEDANHKWLFTIKEAKQAEMRRKNWTKDLKSGKSKLEFKYLWYSEYK